MTAKAGCVYSPNARVAVSPAQASIHARLERVVRCPGRIRGEGNEQRMSAASVHDPSRVNTASLNPPVVIVGAGPAGLTAAYELGARGVPTLTLEQDRQVGGLARTVEYKGFRFDIGGHRFFTKVPVIAELWRAMLGSDLLSRPRLSRIYYRSRFFDYPLKPVNTLRNLGVFTSVGVLLSYLRVVHFPNQAGSQLRRLGLQPLRTEALSHLLQDLHREGVGHPVRHHRRSVGRAAHQGPLAQDRRDRDVAATAGQVERSDDQDADRRIRVSATRSRHDVGGVSRESGGVGRARGSRVARHPPSTFRPSDRRSRRRERVRPPFGARFARHFHDASSPADSRARPGAAGSGPASRDSAEVSRFSDRRAHPGCGRCLSRQLDLRARR